MPKNAGINDWKYRSSLFQEKFKDGKPDIPEQNRSNAILWFNTLFKKPTQPTTLEDYSRLGVTNQDEFQHKFAQLEQQQEVLRRYFFSVQHLQPEMGVQDKNVYRRDNEHTMAELMSGGGRFALEFDSVEDLKKYLAFVFNDDQAFDKLQNIQRKGKDASSDFSEKVGMTSRVSSHDQVYDAQNDRWNETSAPLIPCLQMDIPIGGVGNEINTQSGSTVKNSVIGFGGHSKIEEKDYQLGTMLLKFDVAPNGKARLMMGFESVAPYKENQFGGSHGIFASIYKFIMKKVFGKKVEERSLTGQTKGRSHGIFQKDGSNKISNISSEKLDNMLTASKEKDALSKERFKQILTSPGRESSEKENYQLQMTADGKFCLIQHQQENSPFMVEGPLSKPLTVEEVRQLFPDSYFCDRMASVEIVNKDGSIIGTYSDSQIFTDTIKRLSKNPELEAYAESLVNDLVNDPNNVVLESTLDDKDLIATVALDVQDLSETVSLEVPGPSPLLQDQPQREIDAKDNDITLEKKLGIEISALEKGKYKVEINGKELIVKNFNELKKVMDRLATTFSNNNISVDRVILNSMTSSREKDIIKHMEYRHIIAKPDKNGEISYTLDKHNTDAPKPDGKGIPAITTAKGKDIQTPKPKASKAGIEVI